MKNSFLFVVVTVSFLSALGSMVFFLTGEPGKSRTPELSDRESRIDDCKCESGSPEEQFPSANRIEPAEYMRIYNAIQEMPSEKGSGGRIRKGVRGADITTSAWESFGPTGVPGQTDPSGDRLFGRIRTMRWYFNTGGGTWEKYLGAGSGGLWFGQQAFTSVIWQTLGDKLPNPSVSAIAIDPTNPNVIFVGTGDWGRDYGAGVFRTTNRGQTWQNMTYVGKWSSKIQYLLSNTVMIASGSAGVYKSTNGGSTWQQKTVEPTEVSASCYNLVVVNSVRIYAALPNHGVYTSSDGGNNWSKVSTGLPTLPAKTLALDVAQSNSEVLYASYADSNGNQWGIYKTTNSGGAWAQTTNVPSYMILGQGFHANVIRVNPDDANTVYVGSVGFVKSTDGGSTWTSPVAGHPDHTAIEFDPGNSNLMYLCSDGGIVLRDDAANTISSVNYSFDPGAPLQVYEMDEAYSQSDVIFAGTQDNGNLRTVSASQPGSQWLQVSGCDGGTHISIDAKNSWTIYGNEWCGSNSPRWRSTDQGWSFQIIDNGLPNGPYTPVRYARGGPNILWTLSLTGLYNSYNGGDTWLASTTSGGVDFPGPYPWPALKVNNFATLTNKVCYVVWVYIEGNNKTLHNYVLEGAPGVMTKTDLDLPFDRLIPDVGNPDVVFGLRAGQILRSSDHGHTWTNISGSYPNNIPGGLPINDVVELVYGGPIYVASSMGMFKSLDGGKNWSTFQNGLPIVNVQRIMLIPGLNNDTLRIATYGRGFWERLIDDVNPDNLANEPVNGIVLGLGGNNGIVYGGMSGGMGIKSTNNGQSWEQFPFGPPENINSLKVVDDQTVIAAGDHGTILRSTDAGTTWNPTGSPTGGDITGLSMITGGMGWMCADDGSVLKSTNAGLEWLPQASFPGVVLNSCQFVNALHGMLLGHTTTGGSTGIAYLTTNGGDLWTPSYLPTTNIMHHLFFTGESLGYAVGDSGSIVKTTDAGASWTVLESGSSKNLFDCFFRDQMTGWAVGDSGTILQTEDGGESWIHAANSSPRDLRTVMASGVNMLFGGDSSIFKFAQVHQNTIHYDLRNNWNMVSLPVGVSDSTVAALFPSKISNAFLYNGSGYAAAGTLGGGTGYWVKFSGDQIVNLTGTPKGAIEISVTPGWNLIGTVSTFIQASNIQSSPAGITTSQFFSYEGSYRAASNLEPGRAYWVKTNQAGTLHMNSSPVVQPGAGKIRMLAGDELPPSPPEPGTTGSSPQLPAEFVLDRNYPNPFNPTTTIRFSLPVAGHTTIKIYDALGREVKTLVDGLMDAGYKSTEWNATDNMGKGVSSGMYFCRMNVSTIQAPSKSFEGIQKMILIK